MPTRSLYAWRPIWGYTRVQLAYSRLIRCRKLQLLWLRHKPYLNVGCAGNCFDHFINLDYTWKPGIDLCWDITRGIPLMSLSLDGVYTEHCLEHVSYVQCCRAVAEFYRMLKPGGVVRIVVPDAQKFVDAYHGIMCGRDETFPGGVTRHALEQNGMTPMMGLNRIFRDHGHLFAYDFETMALVLRRAGFADVQRAEFSRGRDKTLLIDSVKRSHESLYVEATKS